MSNDSAALRRGTLALLLAGSPLSALGRSAMTLGKHSVAGEASPATGRRPPAFGVAAPPALRPP